MQKALLLVLVLGAVAHAAKVEKSLPDGLDYNGQSSRRYSGFRVNWKGVISACRSAGRFERRLFSFFLRGGFHDAMARSEDTCAASGNGAPGCTGPDGSLMHFANEQGAAANTGWSDFASPYILAIAQKYKASVADVTAICGAVAIEELSNKRIQMIGAGMQRDFLVGRRDARSPGDDGQLPGGLTDGPQWSDFWSSGGLAMSEAVALMGTHVHLAHFGCTKVDGSKFDIEPIISTDQNGLIDTSMPAGFRYQSLQMFNLNNRYFQDMCNTGFTIDDLNGQTFQVDAGEIQLDTPVDDPRLIKAIEMTKCGFTSPFFRKYFLADLVTDNNFAILGHTDAAVTWDNPPGCTPGVDCREWPYTTNDAHLGLICQGQIALADPSDPSGSTPLIKDIQQAVDEGDIDSNVADHLFELGQAMQTFADDQSAYDDAIRSAYTKMVNLRVFPNSFTLAINGQECGPGGWRPKSSCAGSLGPLACSACANGQCDTCCQCRNSFGGNVVLRPSTDDQCALTMLQEHCLSDAGFELV